MAWTTCKKDRPCPICGDTGYCAIDETIESGEARIYVRCMEAAKGGDPAQAGWEEIKRNDDLGVVFAPVDQKKPPAESRPKTKPKKKPGVNDDSATRKRIEAARDLWADSTPLSSRAIAYLHHRGLRIGDAMYWPALRSLDACSYAPQDHALHALRERGSDWPRDEHGRLERVAYPALLGAVTIEPGVVRGVHRIYLRREGGPGRIPMRDSKKMKGAMQGGSVKLGRPAMSGELLILTEGIETGIAVAMATKCATWAAVSTSGLQTIELPKDLKPSAIVIAADCDAITKNGVYPGQASAERAASRLRRRPEKVACPVGVAVPPVPPGVVLDRGAGVKSVDWLDLYTHHEYGPDRVSELILDAAPPSGGPAMPAIRDLYQDEGDWRRIEVKPEPLDQARKFLRWPDCWDRDATYLGEDGDPLIRRADRRWLVYTGERWRDLPVEVLRGWIQQFLESCVMRDRRGELVSFNSSKSKVENVELALRSLAIASGRFGEQVDMPTYIDKRGRVVEGEIKPESCIAFRNGLLDVEAWVAGEKRLLPHTPRWLSSVCLPFDLPEEAVPGSGDALELMAYRRAPSYLRFLSHALGEDPVGGAQHGSQIDAWHEWVGLCMVADTSFQTIMCIQGDPRTGKGTMLRVLISLMGGKDQTASTTLRQLSGRFGLERLLGKQAAFIPDASSDNRMDAAAGAEILKSISGEDEVGVDRKGITDVSSTKLFCRFTIVMNNVVWIPDEEGALTERMVWLHTPDRVPPGERDRRLMDKLDAERSWIAVLALEGLVRLRERGRFVQPKGGEKPALEFRERSSPLIRFVRDCCEVDEKRGDDAVFIVKKELYDAYKQWAEAMEIKRVMPPNEFGRRIRSAAPSVEDWKTGGTPRRTAYRGIQLAPGWDIDFEQA